MKPIMILALVTMMAVAVSCEWRRPQPLTGTKTTMSDEEYILLRDVFAAKPAPLDVECDAYAGAARKVLEDQVSSNQYVLQYVYDLIYYTGTHKRHTSGHDVLFFLYDCLEGMPAEWLDSK